jgi:hypothetical protein
MVMADGWGSGGVESVRDFLHDFSDHGVPDGRPIRKLRDMKCSNARNYDVGLCKGLFASFHLFRDVIKLRSRIPAGRNKFTNVM